ncbi:MAG TPA: hypothetical protein VN033_06625 [Vulgatibacter sp.]|nr:hypothetical protein [Vulgatibacter sp.]
MRRLPIAPLLLAASCAGSREAVQIEPPRTEAEGPGIGRMLDLDLEENGPLTLQAVTGRVTVVCVIREGGGPVVQACDDAASLFGDRVTVVGLDTTGTVDPRLVPFRIYPDPEGAQLQERLGLDPAPKVLATDKRGRVARVLAEADLDVLDASLRKLVE